MLDDIFTETENLIRELRKFEVDIRKALGYGGHTHSYEYVCASCLAGRLDTFILPNAIVIAELLTYPTQKVYHQFIACGDLDEILELQDTLIREAKIRGASALTLAGRYGWLKALKPLGWNSDLVLMRKDLDYGEDQRDNGDAGSRSSDCSAVGSEHGSSEVVSLFGIPHGGTDVAVTPMQETAMNAPNLSARAFGMPESEVAAMPEATTGPTGIRGYSTHDMMKKSIGEERYET